MTQEQLNKEKAELDQKIKEIKQQLRGYPKGYLQCTKNGKYVKWYHITSDSRKYIPKSERTFAEILSRKTFLLARLSDLQQEQNALKKILTISSKLISKASEITESPLYRELLKNSFLPIRRELSEWAKEPYEKNAEFPENLKFPSVSGNVLRSKSETFIDQALFLKRIPYRYECALQLNDYIYYPDFTIRRPDDGEIIYWEHFGMMNDPSYARKAMNKLGVYNSHGLLVNKNLIATFENEKYPFTLADAEETIKRYIL